MADPVSLSIMAGVSLAASAAGAVVGAAGNLAAGKANAKMYQYKQGVAAINQKIAIDNAKYERAAGEVEAERSGLKSAHTRGQAKVLQGASNLDVNTGSAVNVRKSMVDVGAWDQGLIRSAAQRRAYGYGLKGLEATHEGRLAGMSADNAREASYYGAASSILGGASSVSDKWLQGSRMGAW